MSALSASSALSLDWQPLPTPACKLGESPFWHPDEQALYWCDIPGKALHRWHPGNQMHHCWPFEVEPCSIAPMRGGLLLAAFRDGLFSFDPTSGQRQPLAEPPYDPAHERFNDGKADPQGRFWVGTIYEPRQPPLAALYRFIPGQGSAPGQLDRMAGDVTVSNGLAFSPDGRTMYWSDTTSHRIFALDFAVTDGSLSNPRTWASFAGKAPDGALQGYGGRPDGAAVDVQGNVWIAMFEGQRLVCLSPSGQMVHEVALPVRCATMPCFGGPDLQTLFVTTACDGRPAQELAAQPWAGRVLSAPAPVRGLPVNFAH